MTENSDIESDRKHCWVCFATEDEEINEMEKTYKLYEWVKPCNCKGTTKWVHQICLQRWIDEKQHGNPSEIVSCSQCRFEYKIYYPKAGPLIYLMQQADRLVFKICPFMAAGIIVGTIYWTAVTYGAITVMQVMGHEGGMVLLETTDPLLLIMGLPAIPITLILGRMIRWEEQFLYFWRKYYPKLVSAMSCCLYPTNRPTAANKALSTPSEPPGGSAYNSTSNTSSSASTSSPLPPAGFGLGAAVQQPLTTYDHLSATRILCGALLLPTISTIVGKVVAPSIESNLQRSLMGGLTYLTVKGILKLYYKQTQFLRNTRRKILNHETTSDPSPTTPASGSAVSVASHDSSTQI